MFAHVSLIVAKFGLEEFNEEVLLDCSVFDYKKSRGSVKNIEIPPKVLSI